MKKQPAKRKITGDIRFNHVYATRKPRSYSVSDDVHERLTALAKKEDVSISSLVEKALEEYLSKAPKTKAKQKKSAATKKP